MVRFEGVRGMEALCAEGRTFAVRATGRHTLSLGETRGCGEFVGGGRLVQVEIWGDMGRTRAEHTRGRCTRGGVCVLGEGQRRRQTCTG